MYCRCDMHVGVWVCYESKEEVVILFCEKEIKLEWAKTEVVVHIYLYY